MMFQVGQRVVCIKGFEPDGCPGCRGNKPVEKHTYTIRSVEPSIYQFDGEIVLLLVEVVNEPCNMPGIRISASHDGVVDIDLGATGERGWNQTHFRPVEERKTDISTFTTILDATKIRKPEKV